MYNPINPGAPTPKLYVGKLRHRRFLPKSHQFTYRVFMLYVNCDDVHNHRIGPWLGPCFWHWLRFCRRDFHGDPAINLADAVRHTVHKKTGFLPEGPIMVLANWRTWGVSMNPLTTYYCWDKNKVRVEYIVAEVNNTPWNERHAYVLACATGDKQNIVFDKAFPVSPFNPMDMAYRWKSTKPQEQLLIHIENWREDAAHGVKIMDATLSLKALDLTSKNLRKTLMSLPAMSIQVITAIYWQALRLWLKRIPFLGRGH
jgi:DUF1365 family protein